MVGSSQHNARLDMQCYISLVKLASGQVDDGGSWMGRDCSRIAVYLQGNVTTVISQVTRVPSR